MPLKEWKFQKDGFTFDLNIVDTDLLTQSPHQILCSQMRIAHQHLGVFVACN